jgi:putative heme degradation protein
MLFDVFGIAIHKVFVKDALVLNPFGKLFDICR